MLFFVDVSSLVAVRRDGRRGGAQCIVRSIRLQLLHLFVSEVLKLHNLMNSKRVASVKLYVASGCRTEAGF